jgi:hypothetical protein
MRRFRSPPHTFEANILAEKTRLEARVEETPHGPERDKLVKNIRQLDTASHLNEWLSSPALLRRSKSVACQTTTLAVRCSDFLSRGARGLRAQATRQGRPTPRRRSLERGPCRKRLAGNTQHMPLVSDRQATEGAGSGKRRSHAQKLGPLGPGVVTTRKLLCLRLGAPSFIRRPLVEAFSIIPF